MWTPPQFFFFRTLSKTNFLDRQKKEKKSYWWYYPHRYRDSVFPICNFLFYRIFNFCFCVCLPPPFPLFLFSPPLPRCFLAEKTPPSPTFCFWHCESREVLWLQGEAAFETHSFRHAEPQPVIPQNDKKSWIVSQATRPDHKYQYDHQQPLST